MLTSGTDSGAVTIPLSDYVNALLYCDSSSSGEPGEVRKAVHPSGHDASVPAEQCERLGFVADSADSNSASIPFYVFSTPGKAYDGPSDASNGIHPAWHRY